MQWCTSWRLRAVHLSVYCYWTSLGIACLKKFAYLRLIGSERQQSKGVMRGASYVTVCLVYILTPTAHDGQRTDRLASLVSHETLTDQLFACTYLLLGTRACTRSHIKNRRKTSPRTGGAFSPAMNTSLDFTACYVNHVCIRDISCKPYWK